MNISEEAWKLRFQHLSKERFSVKYTYVDDFCQGPKYLIVFWMWHVHIMIKFVLPQLRVSFPTRKKWIKRMLDGKELYSEEPAINIGWPGGKTIYGWRW